MDIIQWVYINGNRILIKGDKESVEKILNAIRNRRGVVIKTKETK